MPSLAGLMIADEFAEKWARFRDPRWRNACSVRTQCR
jgi:hypothetical protein